MSKAKRSYEGGRLILRLRIAASTTGERQRWQACTIVSGSRRRFMRRSSSARRAGSVAIARPDRDRPSIHRIAGGNLADLISRLRKAAGEKQRIVVCYEAGYDGFWLARSLARIGIDCRVLDPASIQVNRRARRVKTDRIDSLALLRAL